MSTQHDLKQIEMFLPRETVEMVRMYGAGFPSDLAFEQKMTILFSDMRDFTRLAETFQPRDVYAAINASIAIQARTVHAYGGSVNKYLGDGLLACFSGDGMSQRAVECMLALLDELPAREGKHLPCRVGFGLHCGRVLFGVLGDESRREFTVIGDVANTAARLCGIARPFQALVTENVVNDLPERMRHRYCSFLRAERFKGKKQPLNIYEIRKE